MSLEVIGAGLGRTGTLSLKVALEELGFAKCYHMVEVLAHPSHVVTWEAAMRGEPVDWDAFFQGYRAAVDWPACAFYQEYLDRYPNAKVILTVRNAEAWYASVLQTIYQVRRAFPWWLPHSYRFVAMNDRLIWDGFFQGRFEDKAYAIEAFHRHNEEVRRVVPPDRLLLFEVREGWGPLCRFLGVPEPKDKPFPHVNDTEEFRARLRRIRHFSRFATIAGAGALILLIVWLASWVF